MHKYFWASPDLDSSSFARAATPFWLSSCCCTNLRDGPTEASFPSQPQQTTNVGRARNKQTNAIKMDERRARWAGLGGKRPANGRETRAVATTLVAAATCSQPRAPTRARANISNRIKSEPIPRGRLALVHLGQVVVCSLHHHCCAQ